VSPSPIKERGKYKEREASPLFDSPQGWWVGIDRKELLPLSDLPI